MSKILLSHDEEFEVGFEYHKPEVFIILVDLVPDDLIQDRDDCLHFYCTKVKYGQVIVVLGDDILDLIREHICEITLLFPLLDY